MHEKAVLEAPASAVEMSKIVDRRPLRVDAGSEHVTDRVSQQRVLLPRQGAGRPPRVDAGRKQRLVGVDVPAAGAVPLVEQE